MRFSHRSMTDMMVAKTLGTSVDWSSRLTESTGDSRRLSKYLADEVTVEVRCLEPDGCRVMSGVPTRIRFLFKHIEVGVAGGGRAKLVVDVSFSCRSEGTKAVRAICRISRLLGLQVSGPRQRR